MPEISDGVYTLIGALVGSVLTYLATRRTNETNVAIAREKLETENRVAIEASKAIRELLQTDLELRSFDAIKKHIRGFSDDQLRQLLVASGAVSFDQRGTGKELWGLRDRNAQKLKPRPSPQLRAQTPDPGPR